MKNSWFVSILILLAAGCVSIKPKEVTRDASHLKMETNHPGDKFLLARENTKMSRFTLFKAALDIKKHHLSGLLVIKRMDSTGGAGISEQVDKPVYRIVFANEIGMTFFDLELRPDSFKVISCFESLNKKALMKIFETDFRLLTGANPVTSMDFYIQSPSNNRVVAGKAGKFKTWQTYSPSGDTLFKISGKSTIADPVFISYQGYRHGFPTRIILENPFIGMKLSLRLLDRK